MYLGEAGDEEGGGGGGGSCGIGGGVGVGVGVGVGAGEGNPRTVKTQNSVGFVCTITSNDELGINRLKKFEPLQLAQVWLAREWAGHWNLNGVLIVI